MKEFINNTYFEDVNIEIWKSLSQRLLYDINKSNKNEIEEKRYIKEKENEQKIYKEISFENQEFDGLINFLRKQSNIDEEIEISYSSINSGDPKCIYLYEDLKSTFCTEYCEDSWFCFEFKKHEIIPTHYTIRSYDNCPCGWQPRNWFLEGSKDKIQWENIGEENNCSLLNGRNLVHTFQILRNSFKFLN